MSHSVFRHRLVAMLCLEQPEFKLKKKIGSRSDAFVPDVHLLQCPTGLPSGRRRTIHITAPTASASGEKPRRKYKLRPSRQAYAINGRLEKAATPPLEPPPPNVLRQHAEQYRVITFRRSIPRLQCETSVASARLATKRSQTLSSSLGDRAQRISYNAKPAGRANGARRSDARYPAGASVDRPRPTVHSSPVNSGPGT